MLETKDVAVTVVRSAGNAPGLVVDVTSPSAENLRSRTLAAESAVRGPYVGVVGHTCNGWAPVR